MPVLADYHHFDGRHHETGSVQQVLAYQGVIAPHTGQPISEALLLGISGGVTVGYFTFDYEGHDPILALLCRNTFDPLQTLLERLAIPQDVRQTAQASTATDHLITALENGTPALVWVDRHTLPYHAPGQVPDPAWWEMLPVVVYGYQADQVYVADQSACPLLIDAEIFAAARGRIKKDKHRLMTLDAPRLDKLSAAVQKGIWQCVSLYTDAPPKGAKHNFGLAALEHWIKLLESQRNKQSWSRFFTPGHRLYAALTDAYRWIMLRGMGGGMERDAYADFLAEAALLLEKPALQSDAAPLFRASAAAWRDLAARLLPSEVALLDETRRLLDRDQAVFIEQGMAAQAERQHIRQRLDALKADAASDFPLDATAASDFQATLRDQVQVVLDRERAAVAALQAAMG